MTLNKEYIMSFICIFLEPALWYTLIGAVVGAIVSFIFMRINECHKGKNRIELYTSDIRLLTKQSMQYLELCMKNMQKYVGKIETNAYVPQQLQEGVLEPFKRIQRLNTTMVYEAFKEQGKGDKYIPFFQYIDQFYMILEGVYTDYREHNRTIVLFINEFQELVADSIYLCQQSNHSNVRDVLKKYDDLKQGDNVQVDISFIHNNFVEPLLCILTPSDMKLFAKVDRANFLYNSVIAHQHCFAKNVSQVQKDLETSMAGLKRMRL